jgi:sulfonate transport system substrate-binding protein
MKIACSASHLIRTVLSAGITLTVLAGSVGCGNGESGSSDASQITIIFAHQIDGQQQLADASHAFDGAPYRVQWATLKTAPEVAQAVLSGAVTVGIVGDLTPIQLAANSENPWTPGSAPLKVAQFTALPDANLAATPPFQLVAAAGSNIREYGDLRGKKVAFQSGGTINLYALRALASAGLTPQDIDHIELDTRSGANALIAGSVDAWFGNAQFVPATTEHGGQVIGTSNDPQAYTPSFSPLLVNPHTLTDRAQTDALTDFFRRMDALSQWRHTHRDQVTDIYQQVLHIDEPTAAIYTSISDYVAYPIDPAVLAQQQRLADELLNRGFIHQKVDITSYYDDRFSQSTKDSYARLGWNLNQITIPTA